MTLTSAADVAKLIERTRRTIEQAKRQTVSDIALVVKDEFRAGPPRSLGGIGDGKIGSRRWSAGFDIRGTANPVALVRYRGPLQWIEKGTAAHFIAPKGYRGSRAARLSTLGDSFVAGRARLGQQRSTGKRALVIGGNPRGYAVHPGTRARPFFATVLERSRQAGARQHQASLRTNLRTAGWR